ncbi:MAG: PAS domain S-box protein [Chitinophagaceae bacterium]|nr:PAS domain S-box protein [Chitinophagaceae bacterium]
MITGLEKNDSVIIGKIYVVDSFLYYPIISRLKGPANEKGYFLRWRQQRTSRESLEQFYLLLGDGATISVGNNDGSVWTNLYSAIPAPISGKDNPLAMERPIANTSWILHIALSEDEVLKPIKNSLNWMMFIGAILFVAGALITWIISRNITVPIRRLSKAASAVASGDFTPEVHSKRTDELGALAGSFNVMVERIRKSYEQQEEIVQKRTRELEEKLHQLQASEDRFKALLESAPDATIIVDSKGLIALVNKQTELVFGFSRDELIGNTVDVLLPAALRDKHAQHRTSFFASPKIRTMGLGLELFALKKDGTTIPVEISLAPIETTGGKYVAAAIRDISERKQTEDSIREVNRELESFTYSVSHDLRAPLRIIDGYADILKEDYAEKFDEEGQRILGVIKANARRMGQLIDDLLDLSRTSRKELALDWVSMRTIVDQVVDDLRQTYGKSARVETGTLPTTMADTSLIQQVWVNLISNAFKYSSKEKEPHITIHAQDMGNDYHFSVKDNGVGFDMAYADKLFGVFQRLHKASEFEGTGIGLAVAYRIVKRHGGKIWVDSAPGKRNHVYIFITKIIIRNRSHGTQRS